MYMRKKYCQHITVHENFGKLTGYLFREHLKIARRKKFAYLEDNTIFTKKSKKYIGLYRYFIRTSPIPQPPLCTVGPRMRVLSYHMF
jgi:hypothetical protein